MIDPWQKFYKNPDNYLRRHTGNLDSPHGTLPQDKTAFLSAVESLDDPHSLVYKCLLSRCLISTTSSPNWLCHWLNTTTAAETDTTYEQLYQYAWDAVPLLITIAKQGYLIWLMVGVKDSQPSYHSAVNFPNIPSSFFNDCAKSQITSAWDYHCQTICQDKDLAIWPHSKYCQNTPKFPVSGRSLGLALGLAFTFGKEHTPWPAGLYATGALENADVHAIKGLSAKHLVIPEQGKNERYCLLFPNANIKSENLPEKRCIPVDNLQQAQQYATWFTAGINGDYHFWLKCLSIPELFLNNFRLLPVALLKDIAVNCGSPLTFLAVQNSYSLWQKVVLALNELRKDGERGPIFLDQFTIEEIATLAAISQNYAQQAFSWCCTALSVLNHQGKKKQADSWYNLALTLEQHARPTELASLINRHEIINGRHNQYDFRPELPVMFKQILSKRQNRYEKEDDDYALASLYGSASQNYGFCGPEYIAKTIETSQKAISIFFKNSDKQRQYSYQAYAWLEAKDYDKSWQAICHSLAMKQISYLNFIEQTTLSCQEEYASLSTDDTPYVLALLCRFFAELPQHDNQTAIWPQFKPLLAEILKHNKNAHPIQLILVNLGRLAWQGGDCVSAKNAWLRSLKICLASRDTTIQPMALLAASYLFRHDIATDDTISSIANLQTSLKLMATELKKHFTPLVDLSPQKTLELVCANRNHFFPYTYR